MIEIDVLISFFGWCTVINSGLLLFSAAVLIIMKEHVVIIHGKLFGLNSVSLPGLYFHYLGYYKIAIIIFNFVPYLALKIMN